MSRIIAADDSKVIQMFYENILDFLGHEFKVCSNGQEVIEEFIKKPADLLILDYQMPKMNGFEVCRKLRASSEGVTVPIIIVSAMQDEKTIMEGLDAGATDYLLKPVTEAHLIAKLKNFLNISSLHKKDLDLVKNRTVFAGHYRIEKLLGYGSHSVVFLARDEKNRDKEVAIKLLHENADTDIIAPSFMDTAGKLKNINCDNILKIYDSGQYGGRLYLIMEYANQKDLSCLLKTRTLSDRETALLVSSMLEALKVLQDNGLVHFDIKPENILIKDDVFKLGDFGIIPPAKSKGTISLDTKNIWTTMSFLAPENLNISTNQTFRPDIKCDIYSLGVTAYESFTGDNPFASDKVSVTIHRQLDFIPTPLYEQSSAVLRLFSDVIESMLLKKPEERPSVEELRSAFAGINSFLSGRKPILVGCKISSQPNETTEPTLVEAGSATETAKYEINPDAISLEEPRSKKYLRTLPPSQHRSVFEFKFVALKYAFAVLFLVTSIFVGIVSYRFITNWSDPTDENASFYAVKCRSCNEFQERNIVDINNTKCQSCKKKDLNYLMICNDCNNIFPFKNEIPKDVKSKEEMLEAVQQMNQCPKCNSSRIEPMYTSIKMLKKFKSGVKPQNK